MFIAPRFVVIDDNPAHLSAILRTFQDIGSPCLGIQFQPETTINPQLLRGVRVLFLDLHLLGGPMGTDDRPHFANIVRILEDNISPTGGPFVLVVWTQYQQRVVNLTAYINANLDTQKPHARPLVILALDKHEYINLETHNVQDANGLKLAVQDRVRNNPQLVALLMWETEVVVATGATLAALLDLVPNDERTTDRYAQGLDTLLSHLTVAAVGKTNVAADKRTAMMAALAPLLSDRVQNQMLSDEVRQLWDRAITKHIEPTTGKLPEEGAGRVNQMLHIAFLTGEDIRSTQWGAVTEMPAQWTNAEEMEDRFGIVLGSLLTDEFKIPAAYHQTCRMRLIRIGAVCDHAQGKAGPLPYILAAEIPTSIHPTGKASPAIWASPVLKLNPTDQPFHLQAHCRFVIILTKTSATQLTVRYRIREQLLMQLISHSSEHMARPGILEIPPA